MQDLSTAPSVKRPEASDPVLAVRPRLDSIDLLRGVVMVVMALDHVRDYFTNAHFNVVDASQTTPAYFLTRFVTHYCAPTFVFLAGTGAFLSGTRGKARSELAWFLLTRGLWLAFLEVTWVRTSWTFNLNFLSQGVGVLWAIGWSMVVMSGLVYLPASAIGVFGVALICFHNLFDGVRAEDVGPVGWLWAILHSGQPIRFFDGGFNWAIVPPTPWPPEPRHGVLLGIGYPLIPWVGVLATGYCLGAMYLLGPMTRRPQLFALGISLIVLFIGLRFTNLYGDKERPPADLTKPGAAVPLASPAGFKHFRAEVDDEGQSSWPAGPGAPWIIYPVWWRTLFSFLNCHKYPPSLLYVLVTLGPAITLLSLFEGWRGRLAQFFIVFGRVPLFYYLLHIPLIHALAIGMAYWRHGMISGRWFDFPDPKGDGFDLGVVYLIWIGVVLFLWPFCYWFAGLKRRYRAAWLSYL